jgi:hypothetical protein
VATEGDGVAELLRMIEGLPRRVITAGAEAPDSSMTLMPGLKPQPTW